MSNPNLAFLLLLALLTTACNNNQPSATGAQQLRSALPPAAASGAQPPRASLPPPKPTDAPTLVITNLTEKQEFSIGEPALFRISASPEINQVRISLNGRPLGTAKRTATEHLFETSLSDSGEFDLEFKGHGSDDSIALASQTVRVTVREKPAAPAPAPNSRYMNAYVLKAVKHLHDHHAGLGYNLHKAFTHDIPFHNLGTIRPTGGGQTMCVAAMLEVLVKTLDIYALETGDKSPYSFLPFESWNKLRPGTFKASVWVNPKLKSAGTADAFAQFGMGERVKFRDLEPGGFINLNRSTRTGHAVVFISFIDVKGRELPRYSEEVAGFKYFSAQGRAAKGAGGFGYRYAFFSKHGCPAVPVKRDCNVIYSENPNMLNVGQMFMPTHWKRMPQITGALARIAGLDNAEVESSLAFDGLTTDD